MNADARALEITKGRAWGDIDAPAMIGDPLNAIDRASLAESTRKQYRKVIENYLETGASLTDADALTAHALTLSKSARAFLKAAVKLWAKTVIRQVKGQATPGNVTAVNAIIHRLEALASAITVKQGKGTKVHTWLSEKEIKAFLDTCSDDIVGQRDRLTLGLLVAAGLRRAEAADLRFNDVKLLPVGDRLRTVLAVRGKGAKDRIVPISDSLANAIDDWAKVVGSDGYILRALGMNREPTDSISEVAIFHIVRKHGQEIGKDQLAPHDLRRSYARRGLDVGIDIVEIARLLGHADINTTRRYLGMDEPDLESTISDFILF